MTKNDDPASQGISFETLLPEQQALDCIDTNTVQIQLTVSPVVQSMPGWSCFSDTFLSKVPLAWSVFEDYVLHKPNNPLFPWKKGMRQLCHSAHWVSSFEMMQLNQVFRTKKMATDVLTFPVLSDTLLYSVKNTLSDFPVVLGDVFLCYDWACAAITMQTDLGDNLTLHQKEVNYSTIFGLNYYSMERLIHGWCHLSGLHHDTMTAYTQIVQIQRTLLEQIFSENI